MPRRRGGHRGGAHGRGRRGGGSQASSTPSTPDVSGLSLSDLSSSTASSLAGSDWSLVDMTASTLGITLPSNAPLASVASGAKRSRSGKRGAHRGSKGRGNRGGSSGSGSSSAQTSPGSSGKGKRGGRSTSLRKAKVAKRSEGEEEEGVVAEDATLDINDNVKKFFVGTASFDKHHEAQEKNRARYAAGMAVLEKSGVELSQNARIRALAAAWSRNDRALASAMLTNKKSFGLVEVLKSVSLLDSGRQARAGERRLAKLREEKCRRTAMLGKLKSDVDNLTAIKPKKGSVSGALCRQIRRWVRTLTKSELEFYALHFPKEPWKKLADICHFNPKQDFPELPWFLPFCFGEAAPEGSMVNRCGDVSKENVNSLLKEFPIPYSHIKQFANCLTDDSKAKIACNEKLTQVLWYYEELMCDEVDTIIEKRLLAGETVEMSYGKLMERLLTIKMIREEIPAKASRHGRNYAPEKAKGKTEPAKANFFKLLVPQAQRKLKDISLPLRPPIIVIGDRSGSMEVAIRTSTIIASLLTAITSARLVFFDDKNMEAPFIPTNIEEVLEMAVTINTGGSTAPAASLYPFYEKKEVVKTFIMVTDEEENAKSNGHNFLDLFQKYRAEVYDASLVFVSFLARQTDPGQMVSALRAAGIEVLQFKFDGKKPDLGRLENLLGLLASESEGFDEQLRRAEIDISRDGLAKLFEEAAKASA